MKLEAKPCPCGCSKWLVAPLFRSVDATLPKDEADELVRRWNAFEPDAAEREPHIMVLDDIAPG